jgi:predicted metal-dependent enzyme (double-stranded beta helix superfamily)
MAYELQDFVADLRAALSKDAPQEARLEEGAAALQRLLANPDALAPYSWVLEQGRGPWELHKDPEFGFVVTLLLKPRGRTTHVHNHGEAWTLYGIYEGSELVHRYDRHDRGEQSGRADVRLTVDHRRTSGEVEVEPAYAIHNETTGGERDTIAIAVRGRDLSTIDGERFDLSTGEMSVGPGNGAKPLPARPGA